MALRWVESILYSVPELPNRRREKPMEVLALGMSRSGTESLREALVILGYDHVYHGFDVPESDPQEFQAWTQLARRKFGTHRNPSEQVHDNQLTMADFETLLAHCEAITDQQGAIFGSELIKAYPTAKVVLNWRDPETWHQSIKATFGVHMKGFRYNILPYFNSRLYWRRRYYHEVLDAYFYGSLLDNGQWVYEEHCAKIHGLMHERPENFLRWRVQDGWEPLCRFLGKDVPNVDFPSGNLSGTTLTRVASYLKRDETNAWINMSCIVIILSAAAIAWQRDRFIH